MPNKRSGTLTISRALSAVALLFYLVPGQAQQPPQLPLCMACHGAQGNSQIPLNPSLAGQPKLFLENQMVLIREGLRDIPQMKGVLEGLKDAELVALASYFFCADAGTGTQACQQRDLPARSGYRPKNVVRKLPFA
jgi:cytochrome c553